MKKYPTHKPNFKKGLLVSTSLCLLALEAAQAQSAPSAADVLRNIEQNKIDFNRSTPKAASKPNNTSIAADQGFAVLKEVHINSPMYKKELMAYWNREINQPVSAQKMNEFQAYAWNLFQSKGYLAYITSSTESTPQGTALTVNASIPTVGKVFIVTTEGDQGKVFADEVTRRFSAVYKTGTPVDLQGFENQLNAASYDLPVDLEVSMRQVSTDVVNLVIHLHPVDAQTGKLLTGVVQANNYGLEQFGREQLLGNIRIAGFTPQSELTLTTQQSVGVGYYRAEYEAPIIGTGVRWKLYANEIRSKAITNNGFSQEMGFGLTKLLSTHRAGRWLIGAEVSQRETRNWTAGIMTADRADQQLKLKLRSETVNGWVDNLHNELTFTAGYINLDRLPSDKTYDGSNLKIAGAYQKLEMNGGLSQAIDKYGIYKGSIRWRTQATNKNLDSYNKISLGGINGMRSHTTIDGVGDQGAQLSLDITHQVIPDVWGGLFYDIGAVKTDHSPMTSASISRSYVLQGAGAQFGGTINQFQWSLSMAVALGKKPYSWTPANSEPGDMRINFAVTRQF